MSNAFSVGDVVRLRSGGPAMTVGSIRDDGTISCYWFTDPGKPCLGRAYDPAMLEKVPAKPSPVTVGARVRLAKPSPVNPEPEMTVSQIFPGGIARCKYQENGFVWHAERQLSDLVVVTPPPACQPEKVAHPEPPRLFSPPVVGGTVHYFPATNLFNDFTGPCAAIVLATEGDRSVNLVFWGPRGDQLCAHGVRFDAKGAPNTWQHPVGDPSPL